MEKQYALGIDQKNKEPYCIPMNLENIDQVFTDYSKEDILKKVNEFDSVMKETDISLLGIKVFYKNKWRNDHQVPIVTDPVILSYSVPKLFLMTDTPFYFCSSTAGIVSAYLFSISGVLV